MKFVEWVAAANEKRWQVISMHQKKGGRDGWVVVIGFCGKFYAESRGEGRTAAAALRKAFEGRKDKLRLYKRLYKQTVPGLRDSKYKTGEYKSTLRKITGRKLKSDRDDEDEKPKKKFKKFKMKKKIKRERL